MAVFQSEQKSLNDAIATLSKNKMTRTQGTTGAATLTTAQFIDGVYRQADGGSAANITTPTAAAIVAAIRGCEVGTTFRFVLYNADAGDDMTVVGGDGVTVVGTAAVQEATVGNFVGVVTATGTPAVELYRAA